MSSLSSEWPEKRNSPYINRFLQPDSIIPDLSNPQSWNRYSYVTNRPVNFNDPTGHIEACDKDDWACQYHWDKPIIPSKEKKKNNNPDYQPGPYDPFAFPKDAWDALQNPASTVGFVSIAPGFCQTVGWVCTKQAQTVDDGSTILSGLFDILDTIINKVNETYPPYNTPNPFVTPTAELTPTLVTPTITFTPTHTMTSTLSPTPSATSTQRPVWSSTPTPTMQYRIP